MRSMGTEIVVSVMLLLVGIAVLVTIHVCIVGRAFRRGYNSGIIVVQGSNATGRRSPSMSLDEIKKLPSFDYSNKEDEEAKSSSSSSCVECAVCLENFKVGDLCRLLPNCNHSFHAHCIDSWLSKTAVCPVCRTEVNSTKIGEQTSNSSEVGGVELVIQEH